MPDSPDLTLQLAAFAGRHALALIAAAIAGTIALVWLGARATRPWRHAGADPAAARRLPLRIVAAVVLLGGVLFGALADELREGEAMERFDAALAAALRAGLDDRVLRATSWLTRLGDGPVQTALGAVVALGLLAARERLMAVTWSLALLGNGLMLTPTLKALFARARPPHDHGWLAADGFSFPSGHASGSMVFFGLLALLAARLLDGWARRLAVAICLALLVAVGASRVLLQVHYASDVIAGFAVGAAWMVVCVALAEAWAARRAGSHGAQRAAAGSGSGSQHAAAATASELDRRPPS
ncbi:phosphatase PAP2 family protein [Derxia gummosa]|uniref:Phosphatase PAP2 family protein n=1 Tax=Derxia gummosa DSM 723 TaxID=1121388 RepID=A0A8B6X8X9_9BURK|nr:phosphatase PAP2 family protein [Derxia gummosa]